MIYAATPEEIETRREAFIRKWRLRHRPVADCLEEVSSPHPPAAEPMEKRENNERDRTSA
jgi:hypothetical protein